MFLRVIVVIFLCTCLPGVALAFSCPHLLVQTERAMKGWWVPGLTIGVVDQGKTVFRHSFGARDVKTNQPVTPKTMFGIGSVSKSLAALSFAIPHAQEELSLDTAVKVVLPYFPAGITLRHLLSHTAGWPRHDALWYLNAYDSHELPRRLALLPRFAPPGRSFQYNNVPFAAAGDFLTEFAGIPWDVWIRSTVLIPAGMTDTVTEISAFRNTPNRATGYYPGDDGRVAIPLRDTDPVVPAGGIYAHLDDMLRYVELLTTQGQLAGKQVVPAGAIGLLWQQTTPGYGLGMRISQWRGEKLAFHPGAIDGYAARISILPDRRAGVIVLSNLSGQTRVSQIVSQIALDCLVGAPDTDWLTRLGAIRPPAKQKPDPPAVIDLDRPRADFAGIYRHPAYGVFRIAAGSGDRSLTARFHGQDITLDYAGDDKWRLRETAWPLREGVERIWNLPSFRSRKRNISPCPVRFCCFRRSRARQR